MCLYIHKKYDYLNEGHKTIELYIYRSFSRFFLQVKNIFSSNCILKPNIIQTNIIDCMELRSAEIRTILSSGEPPEFILCVCFRLLQHRHPGRDRMMSTSATPSSFTVVPPAPNQSSSHVVFKSSLHVVFKSSSHVYSNPRHMLY